MAGSANINSFRPTKSTCQPIIANMKFTTAIAFFAFAVLAILGLVTAAPSVELLEFEAELATVNSTDSVELRDIPNYDQCKYVADFLSPL
jgi:hypothetical protein